MEKNEFVVILGTAHLETTPGKCSPDMRLREPVYSREIIDAIRAELTALGFNVKIDHRSLLPSSEMKGATFTLSQERELRTRVRTVNEICSKYGPANCIYVSVHVDACPPPDGKWHMAGGWSVWTTRGKTAADNLAEAIYNAAKNNLARYASLMQQGKEAGKYSPKQRPFRTDTTDGDNDQEADYYVLRHTKCPAVLTENLFQDNKSDVDFLLSDEGKHAIERLHVEGIVNYFNNL